MSWRALAYQIEVHRPTQRLHLHHLDLTTGGYKPERTWEISTGVAGLETPAGRYAIRTKAKNPSYTYPDSEWVPPELRGITIPGGDPANPIAYRWMGLGNGEAIEGVGIHGTWSVDLIGQVASHGCIRMRPGAIRQLYRIVAKNTTVFIV